MASYVKCSYHMQNINSKLLMEYITSNISQTCDEYIIIRGSSLLRDYDYTQLAAYIELLLEDLLVAEKITCYDVVCDERNNPPLAISRGVIEAHISYKQTHCLNTSTIEIKFQIPQ